MAKFKWYILLSLLLLLLPIACDRNDIFDFKRSGDDVAPVAGGRGTITFVDVYDIELTINWTEGTDNNSSQTNLQYRIYSSLFNNINTLDKVFANGTPETDWMNAGNNFNVKNLNVNSLYYFNILVRDEAGNTACYVMNNVTTSSKLWYNFDSSWNYRKALTIQDPVAGYQSELLIYLNDGNDNPASGIVDCDGYCMNDFSDLRFTAKDRTTELNYFIADMVSGSHCTVIINTPGDDTIFMYYGNSGTSSSSNGPATFPLYFDHWESDNTGEFTPRVSTSAPDPLNYHQWALDTVNFSGSRTLTVQGTINPGTFIYGGFDESPIGFTSSKTDNYRIAGTTDYVAMFFEHRTSDVPDDTHVWVRLQTKVAGSLKRSGSLTWSQDIGLISDIEGVTLRITIKISPTEIQYDVFNVTTRALLLKDSVTNTTQIPDVSLIPYLFVGAFDAGGGSLAYSAPSSLLWSNTAGNGGMEFLINYWHVGAFTAPEPALSAIGPIELY